MEDDLRKNKKMEDDLKKILKKWRRPLKKNEDDPKKKMGKNEDDLKKNEKWRRPKKKLKKIFSRFLLDLGANLSWGWLSSLRFLLLFYL